MATINVSDNAGITADLKIRDDSPLAQAQLSQFVTTTKSLLANLSKSIDQSDISKADFGFTLKAPSIPVGKAAVVPISGGVTGSLSILKSSDGTVFAGDQFSPDIKIGSDDCWLALELDTTLGASLSATADGFGIGVSGATTTALSTYVLTKRVGAQFCSLEQGLEQALNSFSLACSVESLRTQPVNTVNVSDLTGTLTLKGSYSLPININPLATLTLPATLPVKYDIAVQPEATLSISASIAISGEFTIRSYKTAPATLVLGVYKKKDTQISASLSAGAGLEAEHGTTDLLAALFKATAGGVDLKKTDIPSDKASQLNAALTASLNRSLSVCMNVECTAEETDEAAVIYAIDFASGDTVKTDAALRSALKGDWTALVSLSNATKLRNIVKETEETKHSTQINLLGVYNAATLEDFVKSCTILHDESGQIVITDSVTAKEIAVATVPFGADADKLRKAVSEAFVGTAVYKVVAAGAKPDANLSVSQSHFRYGANVSVSQLRKEVLLGYALELIPGGTWDATLASSKNFSHAKAVAFVQYSNAATLRLFFGDTTARKPRSAAELEKAGRNAMASLISALDTGGSARIRALGNDDIWKALDKTGNKDSFGTLPELAGFSPNEVNAIGTDYLDIVWWRDAMAGVAPALAAALAAAEQSKAADLSQDAEFMKARKALADALGKVAKNSKAAFAEGWGLAVMFALSGKSGQAEMDLFAGKRNEHYKNPLAAATAARPA